MNTIDQIKTIQKAYGCDLDLILDTLEDPLVKQAILGKLAEHSVARHISKCFSSVEFPDPLTVQPPWDLRFKSGAHTISVQVKTIRKNRQNILKLPSLRVCRLIHANQQNLALVELRRSHATKTTLGGMPSVRPYHVSDFDILAVPLYPVKGWGSIRYICSSDLLPQIYQKRETRIATYQPVPVELINKGKMPWFDNILDVVRRYDEIHRGENLYSTNTLW